ncbi:MAG TPA: energy transducer TonB [Terriglobales bacterium]|nr:energy transducer TonB [Terriglobales bacterium]
MSSRPIRLEIAKALLAALTLAAFTVTFYPVRVFAQEELSRKAKVKVAPVYPDIAKRMNITGSVKVIVVVAPNGTIKSTKVVGGHPLLVTAALDALKKWKFETAPEESTGIVEFKFMPQDQ